MSEEKSKSDLLWEVIRANRELEQKARELNVRAGSKVFSILSVKEWEKWLSERLGVAVSAATIPDLEALRLPPLDEDLIRLVFEENPDEIQVLGQTPKVTYQEGYKPKAGISGEAMGQAPFIWLQLPDEGVKLPGGRLVCLTVSLGAPSYSHEYDSDIPKLKVKLREKLNREQWDAWKNRPAIAIPDPGVEGAAIPEIVSAQYGACVVTGEPLAAFSALAPKSYRYQGDPIFEVLWYRTKDEAEQACAKSVALLEQVREQARKQRELEQAQAAAQAAREKISGLYEKHYYGYGSEIRLEGDLRSQLYSRRNEYLPSDAEGLRKWTAETEALVAKVEAFVAEAERNKEEERLAEEKRKAEEEIRRARGAEILLQLLQRHFGVCPFCGQRPEWSLEMAQQALEYGGGISPSCCAYGENALGEVYRAIGSGVEGETTAWDGRTATILERLRIGEEAIIRAVVYHKYGHWNSVLAVNRDALVRAGEPIFERVWHQPTQSEIRLFALKREAENYDQLLDEAAREVDYGSAFLLSFRRGKNPKSGAEQWEADGGISGVKAKFVLDSRSGFQPVKGKAYYCHERKRLVDLEKFKLVIVEVFLERGRDLASEISAVEAEIEREKSAVEKPKVAEPFDSAQGKPEQSEGGEDLQAKIRALQDRFRKK